MSKDLELILEGNILTMSDAQPRVEAVGVRDGMISVVGTPLEVEKNAGQKTQHLKLSGHTVIPGFIDTHCHPVQVGKLADFAVLSADPYSVKPSKIDEINVEMTIVGGKIVFTK